MSRRVQRDEDRGFGSVEDAARQEIDTSNEPAVAIALSGGGSRAIAFHLGCLRALERYGVLARSQTLSTVSGGSVIGTLYAARSGSFEVFESDVRRLLGEGLVAPSAKALLKRDLWGAVALTTGLVTSNVARLLMDKSRALVVRGAQRGSPAARVDPLFLRTRSRTTALARALDARWFKGKTLDQLPAQGPRLVINACELTEGSAFYFTQKESGSWRLGRLADNAVLLADAVTASAAYPVALPALDRTFVFVDKRGERQVRRISLSDGGVYDNTALAPLWPERDPQVSLDVPTPDIVVACRAGYGLQPTGVKHFWRSRTRRVVGVALARAENASVQRLFLTQRAGGFKAVALAYLGQNDARLAFPPEDLVARDTVFDYPTDFSAMDDDMIDKLVQRGEQLTLAILREHIPSLLPADDATSRSDGGADRSSLSPSSDETVSCTS